MTNKNYTNYTGQEVTEKSMQKEIYNGDISKLNVAYFSRQTNSMRHIVNYDKESLKTLQQTDNHTSI